MSHEFTRTELLIGKRGITSLSKAHVLVFGIGGVGSYVVEALARSGVGTLTLVDNDEVMISNINRQLVALHSTIGKFKTEVAKARVKDINPNILVHTYQTFYDAQTSRLFDFKEYDYVVDAIDTVTSKLLIIEQAKASKTPVISCMGTGNKLDPSRLEITDISKTSVCPLAKVMRVELRKRRIKKVKVLYSKEQPIKIIETTTGTKGQGNSTTVGSVAYVPAVAGLMIAGEVIKELINE